MPVEFNAVVYRRIEVADDLIVLQVKPRGWEIPPFKPGQFSVLGLPVSAPRVAWADPDPADARELQGDREGKLLRRSYSIASPPGLDYLEFYINMVKGGVFTPRLFALKPGDGVWMNPKITGGFTMEEIPPQARVVMISTGTGLAPFMAMMRDKLPADGERRFAILHGARHAKHLGYSEELALMNRLRPNFAYLSAISRPADEPGGWSGLSGHVQSLWPHLAERWGSPPSAEDTHVMLCGNPAMIADTTTMLQGMGFKPHSKRDPGNIHTEKYW